MGDWALGLRLQGLGFAVFWFNTVDGQNPALPMWFRVLRVMQDFVHQQYGGLNHYLYYFGGFLITTIA